MANHAFIYGKNFPTVLQLDQDIREIMQKFPEFTVAFQDKPPMWEIDYPHQQFPYLKFYIRNEKFRNTPCLNIRHGHRSPFMWWIEYEIREQIAIKYKLKCYDEGIGNYKAEYKNYQTYEEYFKDTRAMPPPHDDYATKMYNMEADILLQSLPPQLHKYIGTLT